MRVVEQQDLVGVIVVTSDDVLFHCSLADGDLIVLSGGRVTSCMIERSRVEVRAEGFFLDNWADDSDVTIRRGAYADVNVFYGCRVEDERLGNREEP